MPGRRAALWLALLAVMSPSRGLELGPAEVKSALGEKLDARVPVRAREGEWFHARCLSLRPEAVAGVAPLADGTISVERRRASTQLRIRSAGPVNEPALVFGVSSSCSGTLEPLGPAITLLVDPPRVERKAPTRSGPPSSTPTRQLSVRRERPNAPAAPTAVAADTVAAMPAQPPPSRPAAIAPPSSAAVSPGDAGTGFVLRLTSAPIDIGRARQFDDKSRALLRERLRLLEADDQVAEMLAMRDNLRRLEARVAELQLKIAAMPQSFTAPAQQPEGKQPPGPAKAAEAQQPALPPRVEAPPKPAPAAQPKATPPPAAQPAAATMLDALESFKGRLIAAGVALALLLGALGAWLWSRWRNPSAVEPEPEDTTGAATVLMERDEPAETPAEEPIEIAAPARPEVTSDAALATRLTDDSEALRRRYIEERFPEIKAGSIVLDDPGSVVKAARLFYEDGAMPRAVEILRFAVEARPAEMRSWLALFEIYRLERLAGEYGELAARFRDHHGDSPQWGKVRAFGRELDPTNRLYEEAPLKSLETIGPREARRMAAAHADPIAENWLEAPMDFENEVLATDLRRSLMAKAGVEERDLVPNPMPALRSVEMFSVG